MTHPKNHCHHCGSPLLATLVHDNQGETYCCQGCLEVHAVLGGKGWDQFYELLKQSGGVAPRAQGSNEYDRFLQGLRTPEGLTGIGIRQGNHHTVQWTSSEIYCAACGFLIENILRENPCVLSYEVDFIHGDLQFTYDSEKAHVADILAAIARFGFHFKPREIETLNATPVDRGLLIRMAVSGASFANAMAFALANYLGLFASSDAFWAKAFGWFALIAALPAALYGGSTFIVGAYRAMKARVFSIDVTISLGIFFTFIVSVEAVLSGAPERSYADSLAGLVFFLLMGRWAVRRFESSLVLRSRWFEALKPAKVALKTDAGLVLVPSETIRPGDIVNLPAGSFAPMDGIVLSEQAMVEMSILTGESRLKDLKKGEALFAGARIENQDIEISVTATPGTTRVASLLKSLANLQAKRSSPSRIRERVAFAFTCIVIGCATFALIYHGAYLKEGWRNAFLIASSIFTISCACALALALPISRGLGLKRAFSLGFHFRSQEILEGLTSIQAVLFDKTGTLSLSQRRLQAWTWLPQYRESSEAKKWTHCLLSLCRHSRHPVALALAESLSASLAQSDGKIQETLPQPTMVREVLNLGLIGEFPGEQPKPSRFAIVKFNAWEKDAIRFGEMGLSISEADSEWLNSPWIASTQITDAGQTAEQKPNSAIFYQGQLVAIASLSEEIRPEIPALIGTLKHMGIHSVLLSGDSPERVAEFGQACGFTEIYGGLSPEAKQVHAASLKKQYGKILAVGDGFNDSLLLGEADVSIAVAGDLPMVAEGADILFTGASPSALAGLLSVAKGVHRSLWVSYLVSGAYNFLALGAAFMGWVSPLFAAILMPLSSLSLGFTAFLCIPNRGASFYLWPGFYATREHDAQKRRPT